MGDGWSLGFSLAGAAQGVEGRVSGSAIRWAEILPGVDLEERVTAEGIKEDIVLTRPGSAGAAGSFRFPLTLEGLRPRVGPGAIGLVDEGGSEVAAIPTRGLAYDSSARSLREPAASTAVAVSLVQDGPDPALQVSVDPAWLADPARVHPLTIDPEMRFPSGHNPNAPARDAFVSEAAPDTPFNGAAQLYFGDYVNKIGYAGPGFTDQYATYQHFVMPGGFSSSRLISAEWNAKFYDSALFPNQLSLWRGAGPWGYDSLTWNNQPGHFAGPGDRVLGNVDAPDSWVGRDITSWVAGWVDDPSSNHGIVLDTGGTDNYFHMAAAENPGTAEDAFVMVTYTNSPAPTHDPAQLAPAPGASTMTTGVTLSAPALADPDGDPVSYWFRLGNDPAAEYGQVVNSGWLTTPSFTVPPLTLLDGVTYYWKVFTWDGVWDPEGWPRNSSWPPNPLTVNFRLGDQPSNPTDAAGPVAVNLANGNLALSTASPSFTTLGGPVGLSYSYNSKLAGSGGSPYGLTGAYYSGCNGTTNPWPAQPSLVRVDPGSQYFWDWGHSPAPGVVAEDNFCVRWTGYVTVNESGTWELGVEHDDGIRVYLDNSPSPYLDRWFDYAGGPHYGPARGFTAGQPVPITVEYYENGGGGTMALWARKGGSEGRMPPDWVTTSPSVLPLGWGLSVGASGGLSYREARTSADAITLVSPSGSTHQYRRADAAGLSWAPTADEDAVVSVATDNAGVRVYAVHGADAITYTFATDGRLIGAESAPDATHPAAPRYRYDPAAGRVTAITDPVSGRSITLSYGGGCPAPPAPFASPPAGMLCRAAYWDGTATDLHYDGDGRLVRIVDPGAEVSDFGYDAAGRVMRIRDPLAADAVAAGRRTDDDTTRTLIAYDGANRVASVTLPAPRPGEARPARAYRYVAGGETQLDVAGLGQPLGYARRVTFDPGSGRVATDTDATGRSTGSTWDTKDRLVAQDDPTGRRTTTVYDDAGRPTDTYGPAPASCFAGQVPNGACTAPPVARTHTDYDGGLGGLAATWWGHPNFAGPPVAHTMGPTAGGGGLNGSWSGVSPAPGVAAAEWSARFTGEILMPAAGTYTLRLWNNNGARLFVDDVRVAGQEGTYGGTSASATVANPVANARRRIRVDYYGPPYGSSWPNAALALHWSSRARARPWCRRPTCRPATGWSPPPSPTTATACPPRSPPPPTTPPTWACPRR